MKIKALWGFIGEKGHVRRGEEIEVSQEYGHNLIGKGLAQEVAKGKTTPNANKPAAPTETK